MNVRSYKIKMKSVGLITQPADSQKIFGTLVSAFAKRSGAEKASELVKEVIAKKVHLALSNVLPLDYLPMPQNYVMEEIVKTISDEEELKALRKEIKKRNYVKECDLENILDNPKKGVSIYPYIKISDVQQLRVSMESNRLGLGELNAELFTVPVSVLQEVNKDEKETPIYEFCFYLQGDESWVLTSILDTVDMIKQNKTPLILGKRASQGLNKYYITAIDDRVSLNHTDSNKYLNLGMLLPDQIDYKASVLKLFTSERRPFSMYGGWNQSFQKCFISFIDCGSMIAVYDGVKNAGKCVKSPFNEKRDIVFGNAFLYLVSLKEDAK